jgi:hypothetical protein
MQCDICFRTGGSKLPFLCPTDARNELYESRIQNAQVLLERDALGKRVAVIAGDQAANAPTATKSKPTRWDVENNIAERDLVVDRTAQIMAQADELRTNIEKARRDIARRKATIARRKLDMESATNGLEQRRIRQTEEVEKKTKMTRFKWNQMHGTTTQSRAFLCGEAAKLYGLRCLKGGDTPQDEYTIAGVPIVDLRAMNTASPAQITTSLSHVAHLLVLATHYLAIRLPGEITLPHRDYPLPTILPLDKSHVYAHLPFPGTPFHSSNNSPSTSRHVEANNLPRPRPLFINKPLPLLAKEDPSAHSLFLEGTTLLAYNIAWVCKSQGISIEASGPATFEDVCALGRNLYNLLIGNTPRPSPRIPSIPSTPGSTPSSTPTKSGRTGRDASDPSESGPETGRKSPKYPNITVGHFSHGTAHTFLGSPEGNDFTRSFKLPGPMKLADKLKAHLMNEMSSAEWEVLDQDAWAEEEGKDMEDDGVMVGARRLSGERLRRGLGGGFGGAMQSFMSMRTVMDAVEIVGGAADGDRKPGTSGWTKLKPR